MFQTLNILIFNKNIKKISKEVIQNLSYIKILTEADFACKVKHVKTTNILLANLKSNVYDFVLIIYAGLTDMDVTILGSFLEKTFDYPFIFIIEPDIEEETLDKLGGMITDYILTNHLFRLRFIAKHIIARRTGIFLNKPPQKQYITSYKEAVDRLHLQSVALEAAANAIVITTNDGTIQWINHAFTLLTDYTLNDVIGKNPRILKSGQHSTEFYRGLWTTILAGKSWYGEMINRKKNGEIYFEEMTITPVKDDEGNVINFIAIKQDITARKQSEQEIQQLNELLEERVIARSRELSTLYEVTAIGSKGLDLQLMLEQSLNHIITTMTEWTGLIHLYNENHTELNLVAHAGFSAEDLAYIEDSSIKPDLIVLVIARQESIAIIDIHEHIEVLPNFEGVKNYIGVPIKISQQIEGVFSIFGRDNHYFSVEEVALLNSLVDQIGVMMESVHLRKVTEKAAVMAERERLARELHDSVTQLLYSFTLLTTSGQRRAEAGLLDDVPEFLAELNQIASQTLKEMRLLVYELRPLVLDKEGLIGALQERLDAVEGRAQIKTRLLVENYHRLPDFLEETFYRIAQEALNNALKHAFATSIIMRLIYKEGWVELDIIDNGCGFDVQAAQKKGGFGLESMSKRVEKLKGSFKVDTAPGQGTKIQIQLNVAPFSKSNDMHLN